MSAIRIRQGDCLFVLFEDLQRQARTVRPYDAGARAAWVSAAGEVLASVPDADQRMSWAIYLAASLPLPGCPLNLLAGLLLSAAAEVKRCTA